MSNAIKKIAVFSTKPYDRSSFDRENTESFGGKFELVYIEAKLDVAHARLAKGCEAVCPFVNDDLSGAVVEALAGYGIKLICTRSAGFDRIDLAAAKKHGIVVTRVPKYSPYSVAEHAFALMLSLNRKIHKAHNRTREGDFHLQGLLGFDMHGRTLGVIGTGAIGVCVCKIALGFGMKVLAYDVYQNQDVIQLGIPYVPLDQVYAESEIITLHVPLLDSTKHMINAASIAKLKDGVMLINTGRGALLDTEAVVEGLKSKKIGYLGIDVYENESGLFYDDHSDDVLTDNILNAIRSFPNVLLTSHQAFFTREALKAISSTTLQSCDAFPDKLDKSVVVQ